MCVLSSQGDADLVMKLEFDDEMGVLGSDGGTGENSLNSSSNTPAPTPAKPKAPRVKREKKEPGQQMFHSPFMCLSSYWGLVMNWGRRGDG